MSVILSTLFQGLDHTLMTGDMKKRISSVEYDSRKAAEGSLFVAIKGFTTDGHAYIGSAVAQGACAVVIDEDREGYPDELAVEILKEAGLRIVMLGETN